MRLANIVAAGAVRLSTSAARTLRATVLLGLTVGAFAAINSPVRARTQVVSLAEAPSLRPDGTPASGDMLVLAGSLHDHSTDSDGHSSAEAVARWEFIHRNELGIDFGALTDHADFFPFAYQAPEDGNVWLHQARLSSRYSVGGFSFLRGFEYTSDQENHLGVIGSHDYLPGVRRNVTSMTPFYAWLARSDGVGVFNHPSSKGALQWDDLRLDRAASANMAAIEIYGDQGSSPKNMAHSDAGWYWLALSRGWSVGPVMDWDTHDWESKFVQPHPGVSCGSLPYYLPCQRTLVIARESTPAAIMEALRARRVSATEHPSLWATLRGPAGIWQGSTVPDARPGAAIELTVDAGSSRWPLTRVDIVSDNGVSSDTYYDGDNLPCRNQPVSSCKREIRREGQVAASYALEHRIFIQTHGHALKKAQFDAPPPGTTVASLPLTGAHVTTIITVHVPSAASPRPDGKHFFYAIVYAGDARAWTSPILTQGTVGSASVDPG